ncbi:hypothetical protein [Mumia zhuanghuii]|uniref:Uncharacterized protein n=1 Tax=Mumia zhuanghuii TaxID=2585211 RepID=A0A5C4MBD4_9ACTN|nr:hypothetical protein [Mumia zhuanghuii]TNC33510.1 hypothetical protein FHE65_28895 [Mumia zhuanghuii]
MEKLQQRAVWPEYDGRRLALRRFLCDCRKKRYLTATMYVEREVRSAVLAHSESFQCVGCWE